MSKTYTPAIYEMYKGTFVDLDRLNFVTCDKDGVTLFFSDGATIKYHSPPLGHWQYESIAESIGFALNRRRKTNEQKWTLQFCISSSFRLELSWGLRLQSQYLLTTSIRGDVPDFGLERQYLDVRWQHLASLRPKNKNEICFYMSDYCLFCKKHTWYAQIEVRHGCTNSSHAVCDDCAHLLKGSQKVNISDPCKLCNLINVAKASDHENKALRARVRELEYLVKEMEEERETEWISEYLKSQKLSDE